MDRFKVNQVVDLKKVIAPVAVLSSKAVLHISPRGFSLTASEPDSNIIVVLRISSSRFDGGYSWGVHTYAEINPNELDSILGTIPRGPVTISYDNHGSPHLTFEFEILEEDGPPTFAGKIYRSMKLKEVAADQRRIIDDVHYQHKSVVGIPSSQFRRVFKLLSPFGKTVHVSITNQLVKFSAVNKDIILEMRNQEVSIQDVAGGLQIQLSIGLEHMAAFLNASLLSTQVWILTPARPQSPFVLRYLAGEFAEMRFFLPSKMISIEDSDELDLT